MQGRLGGTGRLIILPVDQGFEHGPARSFAVNPAALIPISILNWPLKQNYRLWPPLWGFWRLEPPPLEVEFPQS